MLFSVFIIGVLGFCWLVVGLVLLRVLVRLWIGSGVGVGGVLVGISCD